MNLKIVAVLAIVGIIAGASHSPATVGFIQQADSQPAGTGAAPKVSPAGHSVTLTWKASVPASKAPGDAIIGYIVYRSTKRHDPHSLPINASRVTGTTFVDSNVEAGKTYYYVTRAVSANGRISGPSNETEAKIPSSPSH